MGELYTSVQKYKKGNMNEIINILDKFDPLLNKFQRNSCYEDMKSDLSLYMFNILTKLPLDKIYLNQDKYIVSYIHKSLKNKYININKMSQIITTNEIDIKDSSLSNSYIDNELSLITIEDMIKDLTPKEKMVIRKVYIQNFKESEIAKELTLSRQAIHKTHKRALNKLRKLN